MFAGQISQFSWLTIFIGTPVWPLQVPTTSCFWPQYMDMNVVKPNFCRSNPQFDMVYCWNPYFCSFNLSKPVEPCWTHQEFIIWVCLKISFPAIHPVVFHHFPDKNWTPVSAKPISYCWLQGDIPMHPKNCRNQNITKIWIKKSLTWNTHWCIEGNGGMIYPMVN